MTALFAVLVSGVLLNSMEVPVPKYQLAFWSSEGKEIAVTTDEHGKFQVDLAPGTYRVQMGADGMGESITVDKSTSKLELHRGAPVGPKHEHVIEIIQGTQRDILRLPLDPPAPVAPVIRRPLNPLAPTMKRDFSSPKEDHHIEGDVPPPPRPPARVIEVIQGDRPCGRRG